MAGDLGADIVGAITEMVRTVDELPGAFRAEFSLTYWAGVGPPGEAWCCTVEGDLVGDEGSSFTVLGHTAEEALHQAAAEAWRRIPPGI